MNINLFSKKKYPLIEMAVVLLTAFIWNQGVYFGARWIASGWYHYDMTTTFDLLVPFLPWTICIYFGCYLFWGANYGLSALQERSERNRFFCADVLSRCICLGQTERAACDCPSALHLVLLHQESQLQPRLLHLPYAGCNRLCFCGVSGHLHPPPKELKSLYKPRKV